MAQYSMVMDVSCGCVLSHITLEVVDGLVLRRPCRLKQYLMMGT